MWNVSVVIFGPKITPSGSPPIRSATALLAPSTVSSLRRLPAKFPCVLAIESRIASATAAITDAGASVPAAPSSGTTPGSRPGNSALIWSIERLIGIAGSSGLIPA
jgi:hypothetical protein